MRIYGRNVQDVDQLVFSAPGVHATVKPAPVLPFDSEPQKEYGVFTVTLADTIQPGLYEVFAIGRYGVSNPRTLAIVREPVELVPETALKEPLPLAVGKIYVGSLKKQTRFKFQVVDVKSATQLLCNSVSLDSLALPKIAVKNSKGNTLVSGRSVGLGPIGLSLPSSESLQIELSDELYRGGESYTFALGVGVSKDNPLSSSTYSRNASALLSASPPAAANQVVVEKAEGQTVDVEIPADVSVESGRNLKLAWNPKNTPLDCELLSNAIGASSDFRLSVYRVRKEAEKETTTLLQSAEDSGSLGSKGINLASFDPKLTLPAMDENPNDRILVHAVDLQTRSSNDRSEPFRIRIQPSIPRFVALVHWTPWTNAPAQFGLTGSYLPRGGQTAAHVIVQRQGGFAESIRIEARDLPTGVTCTPLLLHPSQNEGELIFHASEDAAPWQGPLTIFATSTVGEKVLDQSAQAVTIYAGASTDRGLPRSRQTSHLWLKVSDLELAPIAIAPKPGVELKVKAGEKLKLPLDANRRAGGEAKCILRAQNLPAKSTLADTELPPNAKEVAPEIATNKETAPGRYTFCFQGEMVWKISVHPETAKRQEAYRDRLKEKLSTVVAAEEKAKLEQAIMAATQQLDQLKKDSGPKDFTTFFYTAPISIEVLPAE